MDAEPGCTVGILIDLSEPVTEVTDATNVTDENENPRAPTELDVPLITDEIFDFGLSDSSECTENETVQSEKPISPSKFTPEQWAHIAREVNAVADRIAKTYNYEVSTSESPYPSFCHKQCSTSCGEGQDSQGVVLPNNETSGLANLENISPAKQRKRRSTFTKESPLHTLMDNGSPSKERRRQGTFTKEEPVNNMLSSLQAMKSDGEKAKTVMGNQGLQQQGSQVISRLKLLRYNTNQPDLTKPEFLKLVTNEMQQMEKSVTLLPDTSTSKETDSSKPTSAQTSKTGIRRTVSMNIKGKLVTKEVQHAENSETLMPDACTSRATDTGVKAKLNTTEMQQLTNSSTLSPDTSLPKETDSSKPIIACPSKIGVRRTQSMKVKSGIPMAKGPKRDLPVPSQQTSVTLSNENAAPAPPSKMSMGISRVPSTKLQLMQPDQLQCRSSAFGRGRAAVLPAQRGPMKVPSQPAPKMGSTVERPYNPVLAAAAASSGNSQCPNTPSGQKCAIPKLISQSSESSTPTKPSCQQSVSSGRSNRSKSSLASSSDACDSPVFGLNASSMLCSKRYSSALKASYTSSDTDNPEASPFPFKPRKALVLNTPDVPKRTLSRWSPLRRQPAQLEDEVSRCTKRLPHAI